MRKGKRGFKKIVCNYYSSARPGEKKGGEKEEGREINCNRLATAGVGHERFSYNQSTANRLDGDKKGRSRNNILSSAKERKIKGKKRPP